MDTPDPTTNNTDNQTKSRGGVANLRPFKPGQSGNPKGRPKKDVSLTSLMKEELTKKPALLNKDGTKNTKTWRQLLVQRILADAVKGNMSCLQIVLERVDGKVTQPLAGEGGGPVILKVVYEDGVKPGVPGTPAKAPPEAGDVPPQPG